MIFFENTATVSNKIMYLIFCFLFVFGLKTQGFVVLFATHVKLIQMVCFFCYLDTHQMGEQTRESRRHETEED